MFTRFGRRVRLCSTWRLRLGRAPSHVVTVWTRPQTVRTLTRLDHTFAQPDGAAGYVGSTRGGSTASREQYPAQAATFYGDSRSILLATPLPERVALRWHGAKIGNLTRHDAPEEVIGPVGERYLVA